MKASDIERIVNAAIDGFVYEPIAQGSTVGIPWSEDKVRSYLPRLRAALVKPYQRRFLLRDTYEQIRAAMPTFTEYWVVAVTDHHIEFFDPAANEFGLANQSLDGEVPATIGVRGDLIGVFCAM